MSHGPSSVLHRLLAWILPAGSVRDGLLGDLDELYAERSTRSPLMADVWYARQVLSAAWRYVIPRYRCSLFGLAPTDATTLLGAAGVLVATAAVASWLPAHRAGAVDPVETLRRD